MTARPDEAKRDLQAFIQAVFACPPEIADSIGHRVNERRFEASDIVIRQGDPVSEAFVVRRGRARATAYTREGHAVMLQEFAPGDMFGALSPSRDDTSASDVTAIEASLLLVILTFELMTLAERHGCVGMALARSLMTQLRTTTDRMVARTTLSSFGRIYAELLRLADAGDGRAVRPNPVLSALAARVQTTRETASRAVSALERRGIVRRDGEAMLIVARRQLEDLVV